MSDRVLHVRYLQLKRFADGESPERERARVAAHLTVCARCRETVAFMRRLTAAAQRLETPTPKQDLLERIVSERARGARLILPAIATEQPRRAESRAVLAAVAVLLLVTAIGVATMDFPFFGTTRASNADSAAVALADSIGGNCMPASRIGRVLAATGILLSAACADEPRAPSEPAFGLVEEVDGTRLEPGRWTYEINRITDGLVSSHQGTQTISIAATTFAGATAWQLVEMRYMRFARSVSDTLLISQRRLKPLHRAWAVGRRRGTQIYRTDSAVTNSIWLSPGGVEEPYRYSSALPANGAPVAAGEQHLQLLLRAVPLTESWQASIARIDWDGFHDFMVVGEESITVPAGTFDCWIVQFTVQREEGWRRELRTWWVSKDKQWLIKADSYGVRLSMRPDVQSTRVSASPETEWEIVLASAVIGS